MTRYDEVRDLMPDWYFSDSFEMINETFAYHTWGLPENITSHQAIEIYNHKEKINKLRGIEAANEMTRFLHYLSEQGLAKV